MPGALERAMRDLASLDGYMPRELPESGHRPAAVLIPILDDAARTLLFTERGADLKHHAGQISFPGGKIEPEERPWEAALREAHEEIGLQPAAVRRLGRLDDVCSPRGFHIRCYVGLVQPFEPRLNHGEVARLIQVPLEELLDERRHRIKPYNRFRTVHYFHFENGLVWGVTGLIAYRLREALRRREG